MDADSDSDFDEIFLIYFCDLMGWSWRGMSRSLIARSSMNNKYYWYSRSRFMECEVILVFFITLQLHRIISKGSQDCSLEIYYATNEQLHKQFRKKHDVKKLFSYKIIAEICEPLYWFCIFLDWLTTLSNLLNTVWSFLCVLKISFNNFEPKTNKAVHEWPNPKIYICNITALNSAFGNL